MASVNRDSPPRYFRDECMDLYPNRQAGLRDWSVTQIANMVRQTTRSRSRTAQVIHWLSTVCPQSGPAGCPPFGSARPPGAGTTRPQ